MGLEFLGRRVVLVGGGAVSARRAARFLDDGATVRVVAPELHPVLDRLRLDGMIDWIPRAVQPADLDDAWFVHTATGDVATDMLVAGWADERRIWCVAAGDARDGSARTPAVRRAGQVVIGVVSDTGVDPRRSGDVCEALAERVRSGAIDLRPRRRVQDEPGRVTLVGGGPGAGDLLTLRARRALAEADVVVADRLGAIDVIAELPADVEVIDVGKSPGHHPVPQERINEILVEQARAGRRVVRLKGGDPFVYGRGGEEAIACRAAGIAVETVPGVSSAIAVPAAAGIPVTHRGTADGFRVMTGHEVLDERAFAVMREPRTTLVVLMGVGTLARMVDGALAAGVDPSLPVAIVENGTASSQRTTRAPLSRIVDAAAAADVRNPAVIVIGAVAAPGLLDAPEGAIAPAAAAVAPPASRRGT